MRWSSHVFIVPARSSVAQNVFVPEYEAVDRIQNSIYSVGYCGKCLRAKHGKCNLWGIILRKVLACPNRQEETWSFSYQSLKAQCWLYVPLILRLKTLLSAHRMCLYVCVIRKSKVIVSWNNITCLMFVMEMPVFYIRIGTGFMNIA